MAFVKTSQMSHMALLFLAVVGVLLNTVTVSTGDVLPVTVGENVTLTCSTSETITDVTEVIVEWKHENSSSCVLVFRRGSLYNDEQDPQFEGRVKLANSDIRDGDLSMVLKNVTKSDSGKYQCFLIRESRRKKRAVDKTLLATHNLEVKDKPVSGGGHVGEDEGSQNPSNPGLVGGLVGGAVAVIAVAVIAILHRFKKSENHQQENENSHNVKNNPEQSPLSESDPPV